ncbi:MAG: HAD-IIB family hydrolase [Nitrospirota bacterium]|nr:HAD-IIB family hydrolase [Nitrospirota bacterium]
MTMSRDAAGSRLVIFTDLDGTLLDGSTYSFEKALPALEMVRQRRVPLVFVSSKTRAELEVWRERLQNAHPFISENGGGIFLPEGYFPFPLDAVPWEGYRLITLGMPYEAVRRRFIAMRERLNIKARGFGDMTDREVADLTALPLADARLAKQRDFEEPFVFEGSPDDRLMQEIEREGLRWTQGEFFHIMGDHHKGRAVEMLTRLYVQQHGPVTAFGIGDSLNDLPFLLAVDRPVLVRKMNGRHDDRINIPGLIRTNGIGPEGWNEAILSLLSS